MLKYLPTVAMAFLAVLQLAKDWGAHQTTWRRAVVLVLILLLAAAGTVNIYYSDSRASKNKIAHHFP